MLKSFILDCLDCMVDPSSTMEYTNALFQTCIDRVLPICDNIDITPSRSLVRTLRPRVVVVSD